MLKRDAVTRPKDYGGLGILNTKLMNECLLVKWIWKICSGSEEIWCRLLRAKYMKEGSFSKTRGSSQFWKGLHKVKHLFQWGVVYKPHNGKSIRFWQDVWIGNVPLKIKYNNLFKICQDPNILLSDCFQQGRLEITFRRQFGDTEKTEWDQLGVETESFTLGEGIDVPVWALNNHGSFTTKSLYRFLSYGGVTNRNAEMIWSAKIPLKIKIFLWQMLHDRLQSADCLTQKGWKGDDSCTLCLNKETSDHIFFNCPLAMFAWSSIRECFGWDDIPHSVADFWGRWLLAK